LPAVRERPGQLRRRSEETRKPAQSFFVSSSQVDGRAAGTRQTKRLGPTGVESGAFSRPPGGMVAVAEQAAWSWHREQDREEYPGA